MDPTKFFEAVGAYNKSAENADSKGFNRCATVDSGYPGTGPARVIFDGETGLSGKSYHYLDNPPRAGTRVVMLPVGSTYVILGMINGGV